jgi:tRNA1(Val) A37 N6-methylase TrmN6
MFSMNSTKQLRQLHSRASRSSKQARGLENGRKNANAVLAKAKGGACNSIYKLVCYGLVSIMFLISFGCYHLIKSPVQEKRPTQLRNTETGVDQNKESDLASRTQIQASHVTGQDRYPDEYLFIKKKHLDSHWNNKFDSSVKFLSFGSSTGEEAISLATLYFNSKEYSNISFYGVDIDGPTIKQARRNADMIRSQLYSNITFFDGRDTDISFHGKYDVILANSVLCFYDHPLKKVLLHFTFDQFEKTFQSLDASLKVGGLFGMVNSNYNIEDTMLAKNTNQLLNVREILCRESVEKPVHLSLQKARLWIVCG